nr:hypothetical protein [Tanacetum cinerariifolium]
MSLILKEKIQVVVMGVKKPWEAKEIDSLKKRVIKLEQRQSSRISGFHPLRAGTSKRYSFGWRNISKQGRKNLKSQQKFQDIDDLVDEESSDPPLSIGNTIVSGEDRMEHAIEFTNHVPQTPHDSPLLGGHTLGSDEGSMTLKDLMNLCTTLSQKVLDLGKVKTA